VSSGISPSDITRFRLIIEAHKTLADPETRAGYDVKYQDYWNSRWRLVSESSDRTAFGDDRETRERLLSLMYVQRRRSMTSPGLGEYEVARLLRIPLELVEFHVWYLRAKGWLERLDTGQLAISALGVDQVEQGRLRIVGDHLLEAHGAAAEGAEGEASQSGGEGAHILESRSQAK
jgi:hypothetical protein